MLVGVLRGGAGHLVRGAMRRRAGEGERDRPAGPGRRPHHRLHRRLAAAPATPAPCSSAQADYDKRKSTADQVIARLRPKLAKVAGHHTCSCRRCRTCASVAARRARSTSTRCEDADLAELQRWAPKVVERAARSCPQLRDVATDQQTAGLHARRSTSTATAPRASASAAGRSTTRSTTPSASGRWRRSFTADQPVPRRAGGDARATTRTPTAGARLRARRGRRRWCRWPASPRSRRRRRRWRSTTRASFRPSRSPSTWRPAPRWATRSRPSTRPTRQIGLPPGDPRQLPGHGAGVPAPRCRASPG